MKNILKEIDSKDKDSNDRNKGREGKEKDKKKYSKISKDVINTDTKIKMNTKMMDF